MAKPTRKSKLLKEYKSLGYAKKQVDWVARRYTADGVKVILDNHKAHDIISKMAKKAGQERS